MNLLETTSVVVGEVALQCLGIPWVSLVERLCLVVGKQVMKPASTVLRILKTK